MNRFNVRVATALCAGFFSILSCSNDDDVGVADAQSFCRDMCVRYNMCDNAADTLTCTNSCRNATAQLFPKIRGDVGVMMSACLARKDCRTLGNTDTLISQCAAEARASLAPTQQGQTFCTDLVTAIDKCSGQSIGRVATITRADCLEITKVNNERALSDARQCTQKSCRDIGPCLDATLALAGTLTGSGGVGSGGGSSTPGSTPAPSSPPPPGSTPPAGGGGGGPGPGGGGVSAVMCGGATAMNPTQACVFGKCCSQLTACIGNAACANLLQCIGTCPDDDEACVQACAGTYPAGIPGIENLVECGEGNAC